MREHGFNVGGEQSGHIILSDFTTTGDGLIAALQVLAVIRRDGRPGERGLPPLRPGAAGDEEFSLQGRQAAGERAACGGPSPTAKAKLNGSGRLVIRASGTEPVIRVMGEGDNAELVESVVNEIVEVLGQAA